MKKHIKIKTIAYFLIFLNLLLSTYWLIQGDIHYDVDVSRDFLILNDIVTNHNFTLLGPRSGAIPGIFHGPLWFYVNLPVFFLSGGNPLALGWFWWILSVIFTFLIFWITKKLFDLKVAILSTLLLSVNSIVNPTVGLKNFYNPYGAVFLFPLFFLWFVTYIKTFKIKYLLFSLFILGLIIQFQMAFGVPILLASFIYLVFALLKKNKIWHLFSFLILLIPLSTFLLFDIRHGWLQSKAIISYLQTGSDHSNFINLAVSRINSFIFGFMEMLSPGKNIFTFIFAIVFILGAVISYKKSRGDTKKVYKIFLFFLISFWVISLGYQGDIGNYFWPLLPLTIIIFCSFYTFIKKEIFFIFFIILYLINFNTGISAITIFNPDINFRGPHSWAFNKYVAENIYNDANGDFGYFCFSPDRYAYQQRYAMIYTQKYFPQKHAYSFSKKPLTYLIEVDPPKDRQDLNSLSWKISDIKIDRLADKIMRWDFIKVEKYNLNNTEINIPANPYLSDSLFFR